jgi:hypothetical protein
MIGHPRQGNRKEGRKAGKGELHAHTNSRDEPRELRFGAMMSYGLNATSDTASVAGGFTVRYEHHTGQVLSHKLLDVIVVHPHDFVESVRSEFPEEAYYARRTYMNV